MVTVYLLPSLEMMTGTDQQGSSTSAPRKYDLYTFPSPRLLVFCTCP